MKKFSVLAIMALALFSAVSFGARAYAKENSDHSRTERRWETRDDRGSNSGNDNENNADDNGTTTDDSMTTEVGG